MPGNKGSRSTNWSALVSKCRAVNDSQVNDSAGDDKPCDQKQPVLPKPGLGRFHGNPAHKTENDAKTKQSAPLAPGTKDENQGAIPNDLKNCRNVP
jgi:hypothetical protein